MSHHITVCIFFLSKGKVAVLNLYVATFVAFDIPL